MIVIEYNTISNEHTYTNVYSYSSSNFVSVINSFIQDFIIPASKKGNLVVITRIDIRST